MRRRRPRSPSLDILLSEAKPLTHEKEAELFREYATATPSRRRQIEDLICRANVPFIVRVAQEYDTMGIDFEDMVSAGMVGMLEAVRRFDLSRGVVFISYAVWWIRQTIGVEIETTAKKLRFPANVIENGRKVLKFLGTQEAAEHRPSIADIAKTLGLTEQAAVLALRWLAEDRSLNYTIDGDLEFIGLIPSGDPSPLDILEENERQEHVRALLEPLKERNRDIVSRYYGLDDTEQTLEEIGDAMGITRERVRQVRELSMDKMRVAFTTKTAGRKRVA